MTKIPLSSKASTMVGVVVAILIVGAVAVLGYYQVAVASKQTSATSTGPTVTCPSAQCVNVTIPSGAGTPPTGYSQGAKTTYGFTPDGITLVIGKNNTIYWTNADAAIHTATSDQGSPDVFDTGNINAAGSAQVTLTKPGVYTYHCTYHAWMQGKITVLAAPASASTTTH
jgi:plastocyanin